MGKRALTKAPPLFGGLPPLASISALLLAGNKGVPLKVASFSLVAKSQASKNSQGEISGQRQRALAEALRPLQSHLHIYPSLPLSFQSPRRHASLPTNTAVPGLLLQL